MHHVGHQLLLRIPPLCIATTAFMGGIVWHATQLPWYGLGIMALLLATYFFSSRQDNLQKILPWVCALFCAGAFRNAAHELYYFDQAQQLCNKKYHLVGTVIEKEKTSKHWMTSLTVAAHTAGDPHIKLYCSGNLACEVGDVIEIENLFIKPSNTSSRAQFFKKQGVAAIGFVGKQQPIKIISQHRSLQTFLYKKREALIKRFANILSPRTFMLFSSIFLGYKNIKTRMTDAIYEQFQWWGISHYLARSGLHLVMFVIILHLLSIFLPLPIIIKQLLIGLCIGVYMLLSWSSVSFLRALIMIFCYLICSLFKVQQHGLHTISLACIILLAYSPSFLFALDFQLSFGLTLALILLHYAKYAPNNNLNQTTSTKGSL